MVLKSSQYTKANLDCCRSKQNPPPCCIRITEVLTLKAPITTAADDIHKFHCFSEKIRLGRGFTLNIKPYFLQKIKVKGRGFTLNIKPYFL